MLEQLRGYLGWRDEGKYKKGNNGKNTRGGKVWRRRGSGLTFKLDISMHQPNAMHPPHGFT